MINYSKNGKLDEVKQDLQQGANINAEDSVC